LLAVLPLLFLSAAMGYGIADRALRPVDQVITLASRIAKEGQPGERVPQAPGRDELARLTGTVNAMLAQLERQLTRERLFAHLSAHELRTPISVIRAAATLALERERDGGEYRATLEQVRRVSEEMTDLTTRLLALARASTPNDPKPINLADLALLTAEHHEAQALAKGVRLQITADDAPTHGDLSALALAAGNLVQNAIRHAPDNSVVEIQSGRVVGWAVLGVRDRGPGIDEPEVSRLLQPFQRGNGAEAGGAEAGGAGLGLALTQAIVTAHAGSLELRNTTEGGLLAQIVLPLQSKN
jgi:signal transduction histidine kinase